MSDDSSDSGTDEFPNQGRPLWSEIADKFLGLLTNNSSFAIVEFLETLLKFVRTAPKGSRKFTTSLSKYLFATKNVISNITVEQSYYVRLKDILVIYCVLELRLITCFDDESEVASTIIMKISLLMQGSESVTIVDVLIDIDEIIRSPRSKSVMVIVYRYFLTRTPAGELRVLDDNNFIKHLILYRSWYNAEEMSEKVNVFKWFSSTIKPTEELRTNRSYALLDIDEVVDYKKLLQQPLPRSALVWALRDAESVNVSQNDAANTHSLDELMDLTTTNETALKVEVDLSLNLPNETITIYDDDDDDTDDEVTIGYLPKLFERLDAIGDWEWRVAVLQHPCNTFVASSDSIRTKRRVSFGSVTTHVFERCDSDDSYDDGGNEESYGDECSGASNTVADSLSSKMSSSYRSFPNVSTSVDRTNHPPSEIEIEGKRHGCSTHANRRPRKKRRSHIGRLSPRRITIDDWMKRKKCVASGNVSVNGADTKNCIILLKRLTDEEQIFGTKSGNTTFGRIDPPDTDIDVESELWRHSESSTPIENHYMSSNSTFTKSVSNTPVTSTSSTKSSTVTKASTKVIRSTEKRWARLPVNLAAYKNGQELGPKNCTVRLKRTQDIHLKPTIKSSKNTSECKIAEISIPTSTSSSKSKNTSTQYDHFQCTFEKTRVFESSSTSDGRVDSSDSLITENSTEEQIPPATDSIPESARTVSTNQLSEWNSMEPCLDQAEPVGMVDSIYSPDTTTLSTPQLSAMSTETRFDNDSVCVYLPMEFVDTTDDIPSPVYSPCRSERAQKNDESFKPKIAATSSPILNGSTSDCNEISAIENFIASTSQPV